jgi:outer membrane protein assembly factor BamA
MAALGATWFLGNGYWKLTNSATTQRFPRDYYGIGNTTADEQQEEYTYQKHSNRLSLLRWMGNHWYLGGTWESTQTEITEYQPGGLIAKYYSEHGLEMDQNIHGVGIRISRDTSDSPFFPRHGSSTNLSALIYPEEYGADHSFERYSASHRIYLPLGNNGALAFEVQGEQTTSHAPLPLLPRLGGGSTLRGFSGGRYIDKLYLSAQTEARFPIYGRWQGALFTAAGDVFPGFDQVSSDELKYGYGAGIRYALQRDMRINLRLDIAYGIASGDAADGEEPGVYFNFTEAF